MLGRVKSGVVTLSKVRYGLVGLGFVRLGMVRFINCCVLYVVIVGCFIMSDKNIIIVELSLEQAKWLHDKKFELRKYKTQIVRELIDKAMLAESENKVVEVKA